MAPARAGAAAFFAIAAGLTDVAADAVDGALADGVLADDFARGSALTAAFVPADLGAGLPDGGLLVADLLVEDLLVDVPARSPALPISREACAQCASAWPSLRPSCSHSS